MGGWRPCSPAERGVDITAQLTGRVTKTRRMLEPEKRASAHERLSREEYRNGSKDSRWGDAGDGWAVRGCTSSLLYKTAHAETKDGREGDVCAGFACGGGGMCRLLPVWLCCHETALEAPLSVNTSNSKHSQNKMHHYITPDRTAITKSTRKKCFKQKPIKMSDRSWVWAVPWNKQTQLCSLGI